MGTGQLLSAAGIVKVAGGGGFRGKHSAFGMVWTLFSLLAVLRIIFSVFGSLSLFPPPRALTMYVSMYGTCHSFVSLAFFLFTSKQRECTDII